jgi:hypothetical protein
MKQKRKHGENEESHKERRIYTTRKITIIVSAKDKTHRVRRVSSLVLPRSSSSILLLEILVRRRLDT